MFFYKTRFMPKNLSARTYAKPSRPPQLPTILEDKVFDHSAFLSAWAGVTAPKVIQWITDFLIKKNAWQHAIVKIMPLLPSLFQGEHLPHTYFFYLKFAPDFNTGILEKKRRFIEEMYDFFILRSVQPHLVVRPNCAVLQASWSAQTGLFLGLNNGPAWLIFIAETKRFNTFYRWLMSNAAEVGTHVKILAQSLPEGAPRDLRKNFDMLLEKVFPDPDEAQHYKRIRLDYRNNSFFSRDAEKTGAARIDEAYRNIFGPKRPSF